MAVDCCKNSTRANKNVCYSIIGPTRYSNKVKCTSFTRAFTDFNSNCPGAGAKAEQISTVTPWQDLSLVYGNSDDQMNTLRTHRGGRLLVEERNGQMWPPQNPEASTTCTLKKRTDACFFVGDFRVNQNTDLSLFQVLLLREHNRLADELYRINPHWDDERLFQEARVIHIAQVQKITFYDWMPKSLGQAFYDIYSYFSIDLLLQALTIWQQTK